MRRELRRARSCADPEDRLGTLKIALLAKVRAEKGISAARAARQGVEPSDMSGPPPNLARGVMALLRPLLLDNVASIQQSAALALGRLANYSDELAESVVTHEILPQLVYSLSQQNRFYKKAAAFVLRAVSKHSPQLAHAVVDSGALMALVTCLEDLVERHLPGSPPRRCAANSLSSVVDMGVPHLRQHRPCK